ncbi:MAG TPA: hypothetical protein VD886_10725 [Herpetosiphonaceae bacterium]|nr:hypothetical protein [Herpetosiphonaceae bacterium]
MNHQSSAIHGPANQEAHVRSALARHLAIGESAIKLSIYDGQHMECHVWYVSLWQKGQSLGDGYWVVMTAAQRTVIFPPEPTPGVHVRLPEDAAQWALRDAAVDAPGDHGE